MNEEVSNKLVESLDKIVYYVDTTGDFVSQQAPLLVKEILTFGFYSYLIWSIVSLIVLCVSVFWLFRSIKFCKKYWETICSKYDEPLFLIIGMLTAISSLISLFVFLVNLNMLLCIWLAPRAYILSQLKGLIR